MTSVLPETEAIPVADAAEIRDCWRRRVAWLVGLVLSFPFELSLSPGAMWMETAGLCRCAGRRAGGVGRLQPFHGHGRISAPGSAGVPAYPAALDVRWRGLLIPAAIHGRPPCYLPAHGVVAYLSFSSSASHPAFFFTAPNFFVITFALVVVWVYRLLAGRRLRQLGPNVNVNVWIAVEEVSLSGFRGCGKCFVRRAQLQPCRTRIEWMRALAPGVRIFVIPRALSRLENGSKKPYLSI